MHRAQLVGAVVSILLCLVFIGLKARIIKLDANDDIGRLVRGEPDYSSQVHYRNPAAIEYRAPAYGQDAFGTPAKPRYNTPMGR